VTYIEHAGSLNSYASWLSKTDSRERPAFLIKTLMEIKTRHDIEAFGFHIAQNVGEIPMNMRLLVIIPHHDFQSLLTEINPQLSVGAMDRFIYNSQAGIEFGIKQQP
jgi:hypothetical protein